MKKNNRTMKHLIALLFCILFVNVSISQSPNDIRLEKLPELIEEAARSENYKQAAKLEKELAIRKKIQKAIEVEAYNKAGELQEDLSELENSYLIKNDKTNLDEAESENKNDKDNVIYYMDFSVAGINMYDLTYNQFVDNSLQEFNESQDMYSINFKMGHKFYFGSGAHKFRVGVDINYVSLNAGLHTTEGYLSPNYALSGPSPGFVMTYHINDNMGLDLQLNTGFMVLFSEINQFSSNGLGGALLPQMRYWYKKLSIGLEYTYFDSNINNITPSGRISLNHLGLFVGMRF
jgi:hypothetical protein